MRIPSDWWCSGKIAGGPSGLAKTGVESSSTPGTRNRTFEDMAAMRSLTLNLTGDGPQRCGIGM
jgi:hypothetical protein